MSCREPRPARRGRSVASRALRPALAFLSAFAASSALARAPIALVEDVVTRPSVFLPTRGRRGQPAFQAVGGFIWSGGPGAAAWEKHVRAAVGPAGAFFGHNWAQIIPPTAENLAAHPDWFALSGGK